MLDPVSLHVDLVPSWLEPRPKLNGWWIIAHDSDYTLAVRVLDENGECMHGDNYEFELSMTGGTSGQISSVAVLTTEFVRRGPECPYFKVKIKATSLGLAKVRVVLKDVTHGTCRYKTTVPAFEQVVQFYPQSFDFSFLLYSSSAHALVYTGVQCDRAPVAAQYFHWKITSFSTQRVWCSLNPAFHCAYF